MIRSIAVAILCLAAAARAQSLSVGASMSTDHLRTEQYGDTVRNSGGGHRFEVGYALTHRITLTASTSRSSIDVDDRLGPVASYALTSLEGTARLGLVDDRRILVPFVGFGIADLRREQTISPRDSRRARSSGRGSILETGARLRVGRRLAVTAAWSTTHVTLSHFTVDGASAATPDVPVLARRLAFGIAVIR